VTFTQDQDVVEQLAADRADHSLTDRVRPRCARRALEDLDALSLEDRVERGGEAAVAVSDQVLVATRGCT
jgi:hypothetical protein